MEPGAIATRRTRLSLALAAGGAVVLMAGVGMMLIGEVMRLQQPAAGQRLVPAGAVAAAAGLTLGLMTAVIVLSGPRGRRRAGSRRKFSDAIGDTVADTAQDWLGPLRDAAARPVSDAVRETASARAGMPGDGHGGVGYAQADHDRAGHAQTGYERAGHAQADYDGAGYAQADPETGHGPQYSDEGWRLDETGPMGQRQLAGPPSEIHHPARPMAAPRGSGQRPGADTGQIPAYDTGPTP